MIGKVTVGGGFQGLQAYLLTGKGGRQRDRVAWIATRNLPNDDPELAAQVMRATASQSRRVERPVYHLTISVAPEEKVDREAILQVADRTLKDLGLEDHQVLIVAHDDTEHQHVHLMVNRVHPETRRAWHTGHDYARIEKSLRVQERELGLRHVSGRHFALPGRERHRDVELSSGDRRLPDRTGQQPFAEHVRGVARQDLREAASWNELHRRLGDYGLRLEKRGRGLVVTDGDRRVKASFVDRKSSMPQLEKRLGGYEPLQSRGRSGGSGRWRDIQAVRQTAGDLARLRRAEEQQRERATARLGGRKAARELARLEARVQAVSRSFDGHFKSIYRDPASARQAFDDLAAERGTKAATRELGARPQSFGALRGRERPLATAARRQAKQGVRQAVSAARGLAKAQMEVAKHLPLVKPVAKLLDTARSRGGPSRNRAPLELTKAATKLTNRLGWKLVARVVPIPHFQLLRLTVSLGRKAIDLSLDLAKGGQR